MHLIAANGPARSGKDTLAELLCPLGYQNYKMSSPLKNAALALIPSGWDIERDKGREVVPGTTLRQLLISLSEDWVKPQLGEAWFGHRLAQSLPASGLGVISDSRFLEELEPVIDYHRVIVMRLHRPGCSFAGDSGSYIDPPGVPVWDLDNSKSKDHLLEQALRCLEEVEGWPRGLSARVVC